MNSDNTEAFKNDLLKDLNTVQKSLNEKGLLTEEDFALLLMSSILEEEG